MFNTEKIQIPFFLTLIFLFTGLSFLVFLPYLKVLILAIVLTITLYPAYNICLKLLKNKETLSSFVTVSIIILAILLPAIGIGFYLFNEGLNLYSNTVFDQNTVINFLQEKFHVSASFLDGDLINNYLQKVFAWLSSNINSLFSNVLGLYVDIFILVFALFFLFRNGKDLIKKIILLSPLKDEHDKEILNKISRVINSTVRGYFIVALIQGVFNVGFGFFIFGVPNSILWGLIAVAASFIPIFGTFLVVFPGLVYLLIYGSVWLALGLLLWYCLIQLVVDNFLTPFLLKGEMKINSFLILLSVMGGLEYFGPIGLLVGPLIISVLYVLVEVYPLITKKEIKN